MEGSACAVVSSVGAQSCIDPFDLPGLPTERDENRKSGAKCPLTSPPPYPAAKVNLAWVSADAAMPAQNHAPSAVNHIRVIPIRVVHGACDGPSNSLRNIGIPQAWHSNETMGKRKSDVAPSSSSKSSDATNSKRCAAVMC